MTDEQYYLSYQPPSECNMTIQSIDQFKVVIVGGGPAGMSLAHTLVSKDVKVCLVDKKPKEKIGDKVCGDALAPTNYELLHEEIQLPMPPKEAITTCDYIVISGKNGQQSLQIPSRSGTVDREIYGQTLLDNLLEFPSFTLYDETKFFDVIIINNRLQGISVKKDGKTIELRANVIVDASGTYSVIRRKLPESYVQKMGSSTPKHQRFIAYREIIEFDEPHEYQNGLYITNQPEIEEIGAGYYWMFTRGEKKLNVGLGYLLTEENRGKGISQINKTIRERLFPSARIIKSQGDQIPARLPLHSCVANNFIVLGDAAGLANPINGEGHAPALFSGKEAGKVIWKSVILDDYSESVLWELNHYIWNEFGKLSAWGVAFMKLMNRYGTDLIDTLVRSNFVTQEQIYQLASDPEMSIPIFQIIRRSWKNPKLLFDLFMTKRHADKIKSLIDNYPKSPEDQFDEWSRKMRKLES